MTESNATTSFFAGRHYFVLVVLIALFSGLLGRAVYLQIYDQRFLLGEGSQRQIRTIETAAYRGTIFDRSGNPLAISTPVDSVWVDPKIALQDPSALKKVSELLDLNFKNTILHLKQRINRDFVFLKRRVQPELAHKAASSGNGVYLQREYNRFYPAGEVVAHVIGFTDIDNQGREGLELIYQDSLKARPGKRKILRNRKGEVIEEISQVVEAVAGQDLTTSIDMRLQYIAYRSLARAMKKFGAKSASAVLLDAHSGEVLALVNLPSYNPNKAKDNAAGHRRNRAITDIFEPGSTFKPFTMAVALDRGLYNQRSVINTAPGYMKVTGYPVRDFRNYGKLDLTGILKKSSNVGAAKIALSLPAEDFWQALSSYGFGEETGVRFPAASSGYLSFFRDWHPLDQATLAFGYGVSVSVLQLARSYSIFANGGKLLPLSLLKLDQPAHAKQVMKAETARTLVKMMEQVVGPDGTAQQAAVKGYRVAGKTGTVKKSGAGGYLEDTYSAVFAGIAPASNPRLVMAVMVDEPDKDKGYYGGTVAAPVFREVMTQALRLMNISPDKPAEISKLVMNVHPDNSGRKGL